MARWPGKIEAGTVSDQVWAFWDFLPTAAELAGVDVDGDVNVNVEKISAGIDGVSIVPTLLGNPSQQHQHDYLYWEYGQNQAIRSGNWFAHQSSGGNVELYDLSIDPQQQRDLAEMRPELSAKFSLWMKKSHSPSEVWPSPGESKLDHQQRLKRMGVGERPKNVDG
jgi:arylsulfatase A-like enzyme